MNAVNHTGNRNATSVRANRALLRPENPSNPKSVDKSYEIDHFDEFAVQFFKHGYTS